jgi:hypothetical protein
MSTASYQALVALDERRKPKLTLHIAARSSKGINISLIARTVIQNTL